MIIPLCHTPTVCIIYLYVKTQSPYLRLNIVLSERLRLMASEVLRAHPNEFGCNVITGMRNQ